MVKDVNPQWLNLNTAVEPTVNTYGESVTNTPIVQQIGGEMALVMEILKIMIHMDTPDFQAAAASNNNCVVSKKSQILTQLLNHPDTIVKFQMNNQPLGARTAEPYGVVAKEPVKIFDLTDGAGNGILYANRQIYLGIRSSGNSVEKSAWVKILYRLKKVRANELIGIISE